MRYCESLDYYLSRDLKSSDSYSLLCYKLEKAPYDNLKYIKFSDKSYKYDFQGVKVNYKVDPERPRDITVITDFNDGLKNRKIILEIRRSGNEVNIINKARNEDTEVFHIRYFNGTVNVINRTVRYYNTNREEELSFNLAKFDVDGNLLDYKEVYDNYFENLFKKNNRNSNSYVKSNSNFRGGRH